MNQQGWRPSPALTVALGLLLWTFAWDNARMPSWQPDVAVTSIFPIPRWFRLIEVAALAGLAAHTVLRQRHWVRDLRVGVAVLGCVVLLGAASAFNSATVGNVQLAAALQTIYSFVSPLLVVVALAGFASEPGDAQRALRVFAVLVALNVAVGWYQMRVLWVVGDDVHGAMRDAHNLANAIWLLALWLAARLRAGTGSRVFGVAALFVIVPVAIIAYNEKATAAVAFIMLGGAAWWLWRRGLFARLAMSAVVLVLVAGLLAVARGDRDLPPALFRYQLVLRIFGTSGFVTGYRQIPRVFAEEPQAWLLGTGPGSYGSAQAVDQVALGGAVPPLAARYTAESYRAGFLLKGVGSWVEESTDLNAALVEFGPGALLLMMVAVWLLLGRAGRWAMVEATDPETRAVGRWLLEALVFLAIVSAATAFYGWSASQAATWPVAIVAGLLRPLPSSASAAST